MDLTSLRGLEFYSGLGGFHYGTALFNKMVTNHHLFVPHSSDHVEWYQTHLQTNPVLLRPVVQDLYNINATQYTTPFESSSSSQQHKTSAKSGVIPHINIIESFDINPIANKVYFNNFHRHPNTTDIGQITIDQIRSYRSNIWFISNPCQPFTIQNETNLDERDPRTNSFLHLLNTLTELYDHEKPEFLVLENVENFELSYSYQILLQTLSNANYNTVSFILSPRQFGIPNQRSRFFLIASKIHKPLKPFRSLLSQGETDLITMPTYHPLDSSTDKNTQTPHTTQSNQENAEKNETSKPQSVFRFVPTLHFIPLKFQEEYFNQTNLQDNTHSSSTHEMAENLAENSTKTNLDSYRALWSDPDLGFDVLRSTVKPPAKNPNTNQMNDENTELIEAENSENLENTPKTDQAGATTKMANRQHNQIRNRVVIDTWLPRAIPATINNYLVDTTDLSEYSYTNYRDIIESVNKTEENCVESRDNSSPTTLQTVQTDSTQAQIDVSTITDLHQLVLFVKTAEDIDELNHISKKEKNKLKRMIIKHQKRAENSQNTHQHANNSLASKLNTNKPTDIGKMLNSRNLARQQRQKAFLETAEAVCIDPQQFLKSGVYTIDIVSPNDRSTCCFTKGYTSFFKGTGSVLETFRPKKKNQLFKINPKIFTLPGLGIKQALSDGIEGAMNANDNDDNNTEMKDATFFTTTTLSNNFKPAPILSAIVSPTSPLYSNTDNTDNTDNTPTDQDNSEKDDENNNPLLHLSQEAPMSLRGLRYFLPREVANLQMLPPSRVAWEHEQKKKNEGKEMNGNGQQQFPYFASFDWPENEGISTKQKLKLLGNSLNSYIIANLLLVLLARAPGTVGGKSK